MLKRIVRYVMFLGIATAGVLLLIEAGLRLFCGLPRGMYDIQPADGTSLYRRDTTLHLLWTPIPYSIRTNSLGFRGPEISIEKPAGVFRVIALGDSVTDGFYVENENTYPYQLERLLRERGTQAEVVNAARGFTAIDGEFEILKKFCVRLKPDVVVLTFCSNDIEEIREKSREDLLKSDLFEPEVIRRSTWLTFGRTAIGECILDGSLRWRFPKYRRNRALLTGHELAARYAIPGGDRFEENARFFLEHHAGRSHGIILYEQYTPEQKRVIEDYLWALDQVNRYCADQGMKLVFNYYPDYPEVYLPDRKIPLHGMLQEGCARLGIPFIDLVEPFRRAQGKVLHFAPLDFHPNAEGNRVIAQAVADFLSTNGLVKH